jgi:hypothetical protein
MELSPSRDAASCAATQQLPGILWNLKVEYHVDMSPSQVPILSQTNPLSLSLSISEYHPPPTSRSS